MILSMYKMNGEPYQIVVIDGEDWSEIDRIMRWYYGDTNCDVTFSEHLPEVIYIIPNNTNRSSEPSEFNTRWYTVKG